MSLMIVPKCLKCGNYMKSKVKEIRGIWQTVYYCKYCDSR